MHLLINEKEQIVGVSKALLEELQVDDLMQLHARGAKFLMHEQASILLDGQTYLVNISSNETIETPFGKVLLLVCEMEKEELVKNELMSDQSVSPDDEVFKPVFDNLELSKNEASQVTDEDLLPVNDEVLLSEDEDIRSKVEDRIEEFDEDNFLLPLDETKEQNLLEEEAFEEQAPAIVSDQELVLPTIKIDLQKYAKKAGLEKDEYRQFFLDFVTYIKQGEEIVKGSDQLQKEEFFSTVESLSTMLGIDELAQQIDRVTGALGINDFQALLSTVGRIELVDEEKAVQENADEALDLGIDIIDDPQDLSIDQLGNKENDSHEVPEHEEEVVELEEINLADTEPIHFDFSIKEAAQDLNLPAELIEEFVMDFIEQCERETPTMIELYRQGKLDELQKVAHMLKGAASNLRIEPLAQTLYDLQFCNDLEKVPELMRRYWMHFLGFKSLMK